MSSERVSIQERQLQDEASPLLFSENDLSSNLTNHLEYVGFLPRLGARALDIAFYYLISLLMGMSVLFLSFVVIIPSIPSLFTDSDFLQFVVMSYAISFAGTVLAEVIAVSFCGMSVGKLLCGFVVVKEDGSPVGFGDAVKRTIALVIDALFWGLVAYFVMRTSDRQQRLGDEWGHTVVVRRKSLLPEQVPKVGRVVLGIGLSLMVQALSFVLMLFV